jgi:gamma-glutamylcyclotransferase (GGCT)/AIG2-like uncharacterized protein YtfP
MVYIFGYGSLIDQECRQHTFPAKQAYAARLKGYARYWSALGQDADRSAVVIVEQDNTSVNGVLIPFDDRYFEHLDERERGYQRVQIGLEQLQCLDVLPDSEINVYTYVAPRHWQPKHNSPILQSYLDVCIRGCLHHSEDYATEFLLSTGSWGEHWIDDRKRPQYPRALDFDTNLFEAVDKLLHQTSLLGSRKLV